MSVLADYEAWALFGHLTLQILKELTWLFTT